MAQKREVKKMFLRVPEAEVIDVPAAPRNVPARAWAIAAGKFGMAALALLCGAVGIYAAIHYRDNLSRAIPGALFAAGVLFAAYIFAKEGMDLPGVYKNGRVFPVDLVFQGQGEPFRLRIGIDSPREDEELVELDNSLLAIGFNAWATIDVAGEKFESSHTVGGGDALRPVRSGSYVGAAALADASNPKRAVLITRMVVPKA